MERPRDPDLAGRLFGSSPERTLLLLRAAWPAAVGPELARRTEVVALDGGVLRIRVPDASWRRGLLRMRGEILGRLRGIAGAAAPRSLGFVEGALSIAPVEAALPTPAHAVAEAPPLVAAASRAIPDRSIREGFLAAAGRYLGRFAAEPAAPDAGRLPGETKPRSLTER